MSDSKQACWPGWETVRLIGRGSFGEVYEIRRQMYDTTEKAALKMISVPQNRSDIEALYDDGYDEASITATFQSHLESIVAEYSMMAKMKGCANVVNCDDILYEKQLNGIGWDIYIKMELLQPIGQTLPKDADVPEDTVIKLAQDMCAALELCRKHGIIHRDIKPQNIFLSKHGDYKLGDFGIAKTVEKTMGGTKIGTYKYMAPEVYNNQPYGTAVDIYSLGLVMYWLLNKRRMPFLPLPPQKMTSGMEEESRRRRFSGEPLPAPATGSDELKRIVLKACAFDPAERYSTAAELLEDLNRLAGLPVSVPESPDPPVDDPVPPQPPVPNPPKDSPKRKPVLIGIIAGIIALIVIIFLLLRGCTDQKPAETGKDGTSDQISTTAGTNITPPETTGSYELVLNTDRLSVFEGATAILEVSGIPGDASVKWSSSDKSVAKVDSDGEVTGVGVGIAVITATWSNNKETYTASAEVTVTASGVMLDSYSIDDFYVGQTRALSATTSPAGGAVTWKSSNTSVVTVSEDGIVTAVGSGTAEITASCEDKSASCEVTVKSPAIELNIEEVTLLIGESETVTVTAVPSDLSVSWSSDNSEVATVSNGEIQAVGLGSTLIWAKITYNGKTFEDSCAVTVTSPTIELNKSDITMCIGESGTLTATVVPSDLSVSWSSDNSEVATVSNGKIQAVRAGTTLIRAKITCNGKNFEDSCVVRVENPSIYVTSSANTITYAEREQDRGTCTLTANVTPDGGAIEWSSSNASVAQVSGNGTTATVKAVSSGSVTITATYSLNGTTVTDSCEITVMQAASTLKAENISYQKRGALSDFYLSGKISSNYALDRIELDGTAQSNGPLINALFGVIDLPAATPFYFSPNTYTYTDGNELTNFFREPIEEIFTKYSALVKLLGGDNSVSVVLYATIYDSVGNTYEFTMTYVLTKP